MTTSSQIEQTVPHYMDMMKHMSAIAYIWPFGGSLHDRYYSKGLVHYISMPLDKECVIKKIIFLFLNQNTCDDSFEHPKHMFKLMGKKLFTILQ